MSYELIAILVTAGLQLAGLVFIAWLVYRTDHELTGTTAYGAGNLRTTMRLEQELQRMDQYMRKHGAEIDRFIADLSRHFAPRS